MSKHERGFRVLCTCSDCDGTGEIECGVRGANDPEVRLVECPECGGRGEVPVHADLEDLV